MLDVGSQGYFMSFIIPHLAVPLKWHIRQIFDLSFFCDFIATLREQTLWIFCAAFSCFYF
jgi:hypothetical protein